MRDQTNLILNSLDHAAAFPEPGRWDAEDVNDIHYLYRDNAILVRERDAGRVVEALPVIFRDVPGSGEWRFEPRQVAGQVREILLPTGPEPTDPSLIPVPDVLAGSTRSWSLTWRGRTMSSTRARTPARRLSRLRCRRVRWIPARFPV
jgi:hypothetical protein